MFDCFLNFVLKFFLKKNFFLNFIENFFFKIFFFFKLMCQVSSLILILNVISIVSFISQF